MTETISVFHFFVGREVYTVCNRYKEQGKEISRTYARAGPWTQQRGSENATNCVHRLSENNLELPFTLDHPSIGDGLRNGRRLHCFWRSVNVNCHCGLAFRKREGSQHQHDRQHKFFHGKPPSWRGGTRTLRHFTCYRNPAKTAVVSQF